MFTDYGKQQLESDKKEISTNNQDKKYNSKKHLKGQQFLFTNMGTESEVSLKIPSHE